MGQVTTTQPPLAIRLRGLHVHREPTCTQGAHVQASWARSPHTPNPHSPSDSERSSLVVVKVNPLPDNRIQILRVVNKRNLVCGRHVLRTEVCIDYCLPLEVWNQDTIPAGMLSCTDQAIAGAVHVLDWYVAPAYTLAPMCQGLSQVKSKQRGGRSSLPLHCMPPASLRPPPLLGTCRNRLHAKGTAWYSKGRGSTMRCRSSG